MNSIESKDSLIASTPGDAGPETAAAPKQTLANAMQGYQAAQAKMQDGVSKAMKYWQDSMAFGQGNLAALLESSKIMTAGLQEISKHVAETSKANIEQSVAFTKSIAGAKSVKEAAEIQSDYVKSALQNTLAQSRELAEATTSLSKEAARPLAERAALSTKLPSDK